MDGISPRPLFGGAISCSFPERLQDVSSIREVPDNQEVYADPNRDESMIIEILEHEKNVTDAHSAAWFLQDLAREQDAADSLVVEDLKTLTMGDTPFLGSQYAVSVAVGRMAVSKGRQGAEAKNVLRVYLANIRLPNTNSDILVTVYEPLLISEQSETARVLGAGIPVSAESAGVVPASEIFRVALSTFQINDWGLFGHP